MNPLNILLNKTNPKKTKNNMIARRKLTCYFHL